MQPSPDLCLHCLRGEERLRRLVGGETHGLAASLCRAGLSLLSNPYGLGVRLRNGLYDRGWLRRRSASVPASSASAT